MLNRPLNFSHEILKKIITKDDNVIDATVGNGHDTKFLAELVGKKGKVFGFDIQKQAIESTEQLLDQYNLTQQVQLNLIGHENINKIIPSGIEISAVTFNLGYLPKGDKSIITTPSTTLDAIQHSMDLLKSKGIISIMVYYGHEGGVEEKISLDAFVKEINQKEFQVIRYEIVNQINNPPFLYIIQKR